MSYSIGEKTLRTAVFQAAVYNDFFSRSLMKTYGAIKKISCSPTLFDEARAESGLNAFKSIGANVRFVYPKDGMASIQTMTLRASDLEEKLKELGASWDRVVLQNGKTIFAIIPPENPPSGWASLETTLLKLRWQKETIVTKDGEEKEVITTCKNADLISEEACHQNVFLHINSASVSFIMLWARAGFYLGCKQDICFYDPRGTWKSTGVASIEGFFNDAQAVFEQVKAAYNPKKIWITTACGGSCTAAHIKSLAHEEGVNLIFENCYFDLKEDFVETQSWIPRTFAHRYWKGLYSKDIEEEEKPQNVAFNLEILWKDLQMSDMGKVIVVNPKNDQRLAESVSERITTLAEKVNTQVVHVTYTSNSLNDPHFDRYTNYPKITRKVTKLIFE